MRSGADPSLLKGLLFPELLRPDFIKASSSRRFFIRFVCDECCRLGDGPTIAERELVLPFLPPGTSAAVELASFRLRGSRVEVDRVSYKSLSQTPL